MGVLRSSLKENNEVALPMFTENPFHVVLESTAGYVHSSLPPGHLCSSCWAGKSFWKQESFRLLPQWNDGMFHCSKPGF